MRRGLFDEACLPLETVLLFIAGMTVFIAGILLFPVFAGVAPYYENGLYGLLLFFFALQTVMLGKTPFGELPVSKPLLAVGVTIASIGIVTCFIPGIPNKLARWMLVLCLGPGGALLLLQMLFSKNKLRLWLRVKGALRPLPFACGAVYALSMLAGLLVLKPELLTGYGTATAVLLYGAAILNLSRVLAVVYQEYPEASADAGDKGGLPFDKAMLMLTGVFMVLLGGLLVPVNLGLFPFSGSAQLGLLMVIFSVQMLAAGSTPIGVFPRSWLMAYLGTLFAGLGIVSCIVPDILVAPLTLLVGVLNILSGGLTLAKALPSLLKTRKMLPSVPVSSFLLRLYSTQIALGGLSVMFGSSMLAPGIIPGLLIGVILAANGGVLLYLMRLLLLLDSLAESAGGTQPESDEQSVCS